MTAREIAVVVGAGPGLGNALVRRFVAAGMAVAAVSRTGTTAERGAQGYACDATQADQVAALFARIEAGLGQPDLVVYNVGTWDQGSILEMSEALFEGAWRTGCLGGFLVGRAAARAMVPRGSGTILFSGATASIRGSAGFAAFAVPKFGLRALAQSMARELGPSGIHVGHVILDGMIDAEGVAPSADGLAPDSIAEAYFQLHRQPRHAWSQEIDLRPANERY